MKNEMLFMLVALLLFGCMVQPLPEANETVENVTFEEPDIGEVSEEGPGVEIFAIEAMDGDFKTTDYLIETGENPFSDMAGGDLGKTSTAYVRVNESDLDFLSNYRYFAAGPCYCAINEYQSMWITPKTSKGKGVIFEAVYLAEFLESPRIVNTTTGVCDECRGIYLLGKEYHILEANKPTDEYPDRIIRGGSLKLKEVGGEATITLQDGKGFNRDDRWPVVLGWKDGKLAKVIVYMGGYFYDIEEDKAAVPLFGAGNRVLARFSGLDTNPKLELITTTVGEAVPTTMPSQPEEPAPTEEVVEQPPADDSAESLPEPEEPSELTQPDVCAPDSIPPGCPAPDPIAEGHLSTSTPLQMGDILLHLEKIELERDAVIFTIKDSSGNILDREMFRESQAKTIVINGTAYLVNVDGIYPAQEGRGRANVRVWLDCPPSETGLLRHCDPFLDESIPFDGLRVRLDWVDFDYVANLSILDSTGNVLETLDISMGESVDLDYGPGYTIHVPVVGNAWPYAAKSAEIEVYSWICK